ncbi:MAG: transcriptional regulator of arginine metabolism [Planctomycetota bacterium]|jgi:transcriptional regulator of arginine metabolism
MFIFIPSCYIFIRLYCACMSSTKERQRGLIDLLGKGAASSQAELIEGLATLGHSTTQPVMSRDLRAVGAVKVGGKYSLAGEDRCTALETLTPLLRGASPAGPNLVVVHCEPGAASAIARALEAEIGLEFVGTVAGDDTLFVAVIDKAHATKIIHRILELV